MRKFSRRIYRKLYGHRMAISECGNAKKKKTAGGKNGEYVIAETRGRVCIIHLSPHAAARMAVEAGFRHNQHLVLNLKPLNIGGFMEAGMSLVKVLREEVARDEVLSS